ncbi:MAG TPA: lysophospholipid acyltransferase family protein [Dehalococcoidia bacterium]|nr:lysophospholipid acyltransferase family protein [Dehalococcoidia bacterium]
MAALADRLVSLWYWTNVNTWARLLVRINLRLEIQGLENIPRRGPLILASNHVNVADPPVIVVSTPRRIAMMAKQELFDIPIIGLLYRFYGCIPVRRAEADLAALRKCKVALDKGLVLGMFPEGTRTRKPGLIRGEPGTAIVALRSGAPILPVAITGTETIKLPRSFFHWLTRDRPKVKLIFGKPFQLEQYERVRKPEIEEATETIMRQIAALLPEEYRGVYAETISRKISASQ